MSAARLRCSECEASGLLDDIQVEEGDTHELLALLSLPHGDNCIRRAIVSIGYGRIQPDLRSERLQAEPKSS